MINQHRGEIREIPKLDVLKFEDEVDQFDQNITGIKWGIFI